MAWSTSSPAALERSATPAIAQQNPALAVRQRLARLAFKVDQQPAFRYAAPVPVQVTVHPLDRIAALCRELLELLRSLARTRSSGTTATVDDSRASIGPPERCLRGSEYQPKRGVPKATASPRPAGFTGEIAADFVGIGSPSAKRSTYALAVAIASPTDRVRLILGRMPRMRQSIGWRTVSRPNW